jgi:hypothetical protein
MCTMCRDAPVTAAAPITSLDRFNGGAGLDAARATRVGVGRQPAIRSQTEHVGHTIKGLDALAFEILAVLVQVNESRSDH